MKNPNAFTLRLQILRAAQNDRTKGEQKESKKMPSFKKKGGEVFKKDAELFLKPQGLLATSGVGCMASVYIHIGNANIHIGNVNIRIGSHVRTHWVTRTYASGNTYVRIGQHVRTH